MSSFVRLCVLIFTVVSVLLKAQTNPSYTVFTGNLQGVNGGAIAPANTIILPVTNKSNYLNTVLRETNKSAKLYLKLDAGNDYIKSNSVAWVFTATVIFDYKLVNAGPSYQRTLSINNNTPEFLKIDDLLPNFITPTQGFTLTIGSVDLKDGANNNLTTGLLYDFLSKNLRLTASLNREYNVDVRMATNSLMSAQPVIYPVAISGRLVTFSWQPAVSVPYPDYELQVLKLYNTDESFKNDLNQIATTVDWSKALKVETQSHNTTIRLTMAEGTGYYIWRVRPIGTYFPGGFSNSENYGEWSYVVNSGTIALNKNTLATNNPNLFAFYLTDPDADINWIYNRVFTEGDDYNKSSPTGIKSSEGITYADGLQRVRQSQKYNSSEDTRLISQTVSDYSGRPALTSIPVPTIGALNGYKKNLLTNTSNALYTAKQFDEDVNLNDPDKVQDFNTAFSYYSDYSTLINPGIDNSNVPDAQGYPFKRTLYKNDGSNRVIEESGIGKTHALGLQSNGRGRTTRIFYGIPSDDELIRIFGDEAPLSESVVKTTTIDQNNVVSITYTSKEGKTIATALSSYTTQNLSALSGTVQLRSVINAVNENVSSGGRIVASKRISILNDNTNVNISYTTENLPMASAGCLSAGCNYEMRFYMVDLNTNKTFMSDVDLTNPAITNFTTSGDITDFPNNWGLVEVGGTQTIIPGGGSLQNQLTLNSGEYIFIKEFYSTNSSNYAEDLANAENDKTRIILDAIAAQMQDVTNPLKRIAFDAWMTTFKGLVVSYNAGAAVGAQILSHLCLTNNVPPGFQFPHAPDFDIAALTPSSDDPASSDMVISTKCCGQMSVQMPNNTVCYACDGSSDPQYQQVVSINTMTLANMNSVRGDVIPYGLKDFEADPSWAGLSIADKRSAISQVVEREFIDALKDHMDEDQINYNDLWKLTPGFTFGSLNFMLTNMLISQYYTGNVINNGGTWYEATKDATGNYLLGSPVLAYSTNYPHNYDCEKLWQTWVGSVAMEGSFELEGSDQNIVKEYDKSEGPLATLLACINTDNWSPALKSALDFAKLTLGKVIDKFSKSRDGALTPSQMAAQTGITGSFLFQVKPSFAAIIDGERLPGYIANSGSPAFPSDYFDYTGTPNPQDPNIYTSVQTGGYKHQYVPQLFDNSGTLILTNCDGTDFPELYYPYVLKPEWMFKYYVYNVFENNGAGPGTTNFIDDADYLLPNQVTTDLALCYNEPFSYLPNSITNGTLQPGNLCKQTAKPTFTLGASTSTLSFVHINWSSDERQEFYTQIKGAARCYTTKGISLTDTYYNPPGSLPTCQTKTVLVSEALAVLAQRTVDCQDMAPRIKAALLSELESACYTLVSCASAPTRVPGEITMAEVDLMVAAVISDAIQLINNIASKLTFGANNTSACTSSTLITDNYSNNQCDLPACSQENCVEIFLYEDNTLGRTDSRTITVKYFADCDQKILDMLETGVFLPDIRPAQGVTCTKPLKIWQQCTGTTGAPCSPDYEEKTGCTNPDFEKYSKEYNITATGN